MRIHRLYIGDFGIFRNQTLDELSPGLVVIGGLNRAGKTTFLQILRCLGYGIPRGQSLPPAAGRYEVECDVILDAGDRFCIRLMGHGDPQVSCVVGTSQINSCRELFNDLDHYTYCQLFTISLDELQRIQNTKDQDLEKLHSIMLGAGLADIAGIPQIVEEFQKLTRDLGGNQGKVNVGKFKDFHNIIKEGVALRDEATEQIRLYQDVTERLNQVVKEIQEAEVGLTSLQGRLTLLDVLKNCFQDYLRFQTLRGSVEADGVEDLIREFADVHMETVIHLWNQYEMVLKEYENQLMVFGRNLVNDDLQDSVERLIKHSAGLEGFGFRLSGLKEKVENYTRQYLSHINEKHGIVAELARINKSWDGQFEPVLELECDKLQLDELSQDVSAYLQAEKGLHEKESEITRLEREKERIEIELSTIETFEDNVALRRYFHLAVLFAVGGVALSIWNIWVGMTAGFLGIIGAAVYAIVRFFMTNMTRQRKRDLEFQLKGVSTQIKAFEDDVMSLNNTKLEFAKKLQHYRDLLQLRQDVSPELIREYFRDVQELRKIILRWEAFDDELQVIRGSIEKDLGELGKLLNRLQGIIHLQIHDDRLWEHKAQLFGLLEESLRLLDLAKDIKAVENRKKEIEEQICEIVQCDDFSSLSERMEEFSQRAKTAVKLRDMKEEYDRLQKQIIQTLTMEATRKALSDHGGEMDFTDDNLLMDVFSRLCQQFTSAESVGKAYEECAEEVVLLQKRLEELKDRRRLLGLEQKQLATTEKLEQAQQKIDKARTGLRPLAEKYGKYNTAAFILRKVQERFMSKTKDSLLKDASVALGRITGGEYIEILPPDMLNEVDFKTVLTDGTRQDTVDILSRATCEQLFFAIRFSRIQDIKPPLPVIIDDSFVNFDRYHLKQVIRILTELSETHQVFLLTCHPHLVNYISRDGKDAQFWKLEQGKFNSCSGQELIEYLGIANESWI